MDKAQTWAHHQASLARQKVARLWEELGPWIRQVQGRDPLVAGTLYERRRRCGRSRCGCAGDNRLHKSLAFSVSDKGRTRLIPLSGLDLSRLRSCLQEDQRVREARRHMKQLCERLLKEADQLHRLRRIHPPALPGNGTRKGPSDPGREELLGRGHIS